jgi:hypothetical protein
MLPEKKRTVETSVEIRRTWFLWYRFGLLDSFLNSDLTPETRYNEVRAWKGTR